MVGTWSYRSPFLPGQVYYEWRIRNTVADLLEWLTFGFLLATFGVLGLMLIYLRWVIPKIVSNFSGLLQKSVLEWAFERTEQAQPDGSTRTVLVPSPRAMAMVDAVAPLFVARMIEWGKKNIKLGGAGGSAGPGGAGGSPMEGLLGMLPKQYRGMAQMFLPTILEKVMGGGAAKGGAKKPGATEIGESPFAKEIQP